MKIVRRIGALLGAGASVPHRKNTAEHTTVDMPPPAVITLPMQQHIGVPCIPAVETGESVAVGQIVGDSGHPLSVPIHSGISGKVKGISEITLPGGQTCVAVTIESDGERRLHPDLRPPEVSGRESFLRAVRASGLVGLGGAGFPTYVKLNPKNPGEIDTLLINAAECEPYITSDYRECMENAPDILLGIQKTMEYLQIPRAIVGIEDNKPAAVSLLRKLAAEILPARSVQVKSLPPRYPQGAEKVLIRACTGRRVPPGKLPADVGCIVLNVSTAGFLGRYLRTGMPLVEKRLTVAGGAAARPQNLRVIIGTRISEVLEFCGANLEKTEKLLMGGPMMGLALPGAELPVLKQNNALLALGEQEARRRAETACIRCGRCVHGCPMRLEPLSIAAAYRIGDARGMERLHVLSCIECGCCSYVCPAARHLTQTMRLSKTAVREAQAAGK